jgi:hypothetical protein
MRVNCTKGGRVGWCAVGFNAPTETMSGASVIMGFSNKINEYRALGTYLPIKAVSRLTNARSAAIGVKRSLEFTRPLSMATDSSYYPITSGIMNVMVVYNDVTTPRSDTSWVQHTQTNIIPIDLFASYPCSWTCGGKDSKDPNVCSKHGSCVSQDTCTCNVGYTGNICQTYSCSNVDSKSTSVCSGNGVCIASNTCQCSAGYSGAKCDVLSCYGKLTSNPAAVCSGNGTCTGPDQCTCKAGYIGTECQTLKPVIPPQTISCFGYLQNDPSACFGHGNCYSKDNCTCTQPYFGQDCANFTCFGKSLWGGQCSRSGLCTSPDVCKCMKGYTGQQCEFYVCFNLQQFDVNVCNGNGTCIGPNVCECKSGFQGDQCQYSLDQNVDPVPPPPPVTIPQVSPERVNCMVLGDNKVNWVVQNGTLYMKIEFIAGLNGWAAVGFNKDGQTMLNGNMIMLYDGNINEYSASGYSLPFLISTRISNVNSGTHGNDTVVLQFSRPMSDPLDTGYVNLSDQYNTLMIALNQNQKPKTPNNFPMHEHQYFARVDFKGKYVCNSSSPRNSMALLVVLLSIFLALQ